MLKNWKTLLVSMICLLSIYLALPSLVPSQSSLSRFLPDARVNLGLDLRGGMLMLLEVDAKDYHREQRDYIIDSLQSLLREGGQSATVYEDKEEVVVQFADAPSPKSLVMITNFSNDIGKLDMNTSGQQVRLGFTEGYNKQVQDKLMAQSIEIVRRRIDELGTKEIDLQRQGDSYIALQAPGISNPEEIKKLLGKTAKLTFSLIDEGATLAWHKERRIKMGTRVVMGEHGAIVAHLRPSITGDMLVGAHVTVQESKPGVSITFNNMGSKLFADFTTKYTKQRLAIILDDHVLSAPVINEPILGGNSFISGAFTVQSAGELALLLRAGALPAQLNVVEERMVGPTLGSDSVDAGVKAVFMGALAVVLIMGICYGKFGMVANLALVINLFMIIAALALVGATLTLPGIAGMVLTLGMAVDSNVLIFERMREEIRKGSKPFSAIMGGYDAAFITILDSNLTTMLAAVILYGLGSGPIRGFAVTLCIGILCSMFTSITVTRLIIDWWCRRYKPMALPL